MEINFYTRILQHLYVGISRHKKSFVSGKRKRRAEVESGKRKAEAESGKGKAELPRTTN